MNTDDPTLKSFFRSPARAVPALMLIALSFCGFRCSLDHHFNLGPVVVGTGSVTTDSRTPGTFDAVDMSGSFDTEWTKGDTTTVVVEAQANLVPHIKTEIQNGTLRIYSDTAFETTAPLKVKVTGKDLHRLVLSGSGELTAKGITGASLEVVLSGSGDITLTGDVQDFIATLSGSGDIHGGDLKTHNATATVTGSGDIETFALDQLTATVTGSGTITYSGNPKAVSKKITGSGDIDAK